MKFPAVAIDSVYVKWPPLLRSRACVHGNSAYLVTFVSVGMAAVVESCVIILILLQAVEPPPPPH